MANIGVESQFLFFLPDEEEGEIDDEDKDDNGDNEDDDDNDNTAPSFLTIFETMITFRRLGGY